MLTGHCYCKEMKNDQRPSLMLVGDSISVQMEPWLRKYVEGRVSILPREGREEAMANPDLPTGANGGDSNMVLESLRQKLVTEKLRPDFTLLNCGLHDIKRHPETREIQVPSPLYRENLEAICELFSARGLRFAWIRTTGLVNEIHNSKHTKQFQRFEADHKEYDSIAVEVMAARKILCLDLKTVSGNYTPEVYIDHVHFSDEVRSLQAAFLAGWLEREFLVV